MGNAAPVGSTETAMVDIEQVKRRSNPALAVARYHLERERGLAVDYEVSREVLGRGACGSVVAARRRADGKRCALKDLSKVNLPKKAMLQQRVAEVEIHMSVDHPNVTRVIDVYESETSIAVVTERCEGGELYAALEEKSIYCDIAAAETARQMLCVAKHLHLRSIVHRDFKLENFLYQEKDPVVQLDRFVDAVQANNCEHMQIEAPLLKLIDFGFAKVWDPETLMMTSCGSAEYVSPDVLCGTGYTDKCDIWSIGVIAWMLLTGYPPFHGEKKQMIANIKTARADWSHKSRWNKVSTDAKDFVRQLLVKNPEQRPDAGAALNHAWFRRFEVRKTKPLVAYDSILLSMQRYIETSRLRRAAMQLLVQQLDVEETRELRTLFFNIDEESKGWISVQEFAKAVQDLQNISQQSIFQDPQSGTPEGLFQMLDASGDDHIYFSEFLAATATVNAHSHKRPIKAVFARLDADNSGSIGVDDLRIAFGESFEGAAVKDLLLEAKLPSENGVHGELSFPEFVEAVTLSPSIVEYEVSPKRDAGGLPCGLDVFSGNLGIIPKLLAI